MKPWTGPAVAGALVAGLLAGTVLHLTLDEPASTAGTGETTATSPTASKASGTRSSGGKATGSKTPSGSESATDPSTTDPDPTTSDGEPAFTARALLTPDDLMAHGWGNTKVTAQGDGLPTDDIIRCTGIDPDAGGRVAAHWATYKGAQTTAGEIVVRYENTYAANVAAGYSFNQANQCEGAGEHHDFSGGAITQGTWFTYEGDGVRAVIAAGLVQDRLFVFSMSSSKSDPAETTHVDQLMRQAGARLI